MKFSVVFCVLVLLQASRGQQCRLDGSKSSIKIRDCTDVSFEQSKLSSGFEMEGIEKMEAGDLNNNKFPRIDEQMFQQMTQLVELRLHGCDIESLSENAFTNLRILKVLSLRNNEIKALHEATFRNLESLEDLNLALNRLEMVPANLFEANRKLKKLDLHRNRIKGLPEGLFGNLADLERLSIGGNEIEVIHRSIFQQNGKLRWLYLHQNKIHAISEGTFDGLVKLTRLYLEENSCVNKLYVDYGDPNVTVDFERVSLDLGVCYNNYCEFFVPEKQ
jgi:Leucine-rich repeat (LRR) protein